jgi:pyruvate/2-oxoglutarate dehydrogenase complex dihydrolipoamide dehydrogenase (E3) component
MGEAIKERDGFLTAKVLASKRDGKILDCHIVGSHASILHMK